MPNPNSRGSRFFYGPECEGVTHGNNYSTVCYCVWCHMWRNVYGQSYQDRLERDRERKRAVRAAEKASREAVDEFVVESLVMGHYLTHNAAERRTAVLHLIQRGHTHRNIGRMLRCSERTIDRDVVDHKTAGRL